MREEIIKRFGSLAKFCRYSGCVYSYSYKLIADAEKGSKTAKYRLLAYIAVADANIVTRDKLVALFRRKLNGDYKKLLALVRLDLPHTTAKRLHHYMTIKQDVSDSCKLMQSINTRLSALPDISIKTFNS